MQNSRMSTCHSTIRLLSYLPLKMSHYPWPLSFQYSGRRMWLAWLSQNLCIGHGACQQSTYKLVVPICVCYFLSPWCRCKGWLEQVFQRQKAYTYLALWVGVKTPFSISFHSIFIPPIHPPIKHPEYCHATGLQPPFIVQKIDGCLKHWFCVVDLKAASTNFFGDIAPNRTKSNKLAYNGKYSKEASKCTMMYVAIRSGEVRVARDLVFQYFVGQCFFTLEIVVGSI